MFANFINTVSGFLWGWFLWIAILCVGAWLTYAIGGISLKKIPYGFRQLWYGRAARGDGTIPPFSPSMVSLSATIGTGNIVGVATAIGIGGPGALFWMWCSALLGMATKYAEAVCAVKFREKNQQGHFIGGPMYYIKNGLGKNWHWLAGCFAGFGALAGFGIGNAVQAHSVSEALEQSFGISPLLTAAVLIVLVGLVLIGGIKSIANVARTLVPFMSISYLLVGLAILFVNIGEIPSAIALIVKSAFTGTAAQGGFAGAAVIVAIRMGVARGVFSNEAGLGSAPIAHAAAATDHPVRQGIVAMLGTFIDTLIICSITGLAIVVTGAWSGDAKGVLMSQAAFTSLFSHGDKIVSLTLCVFAFTTILGWSYYGERCAEYLLGEKISLYYRIAWVCVLFVGIHFSLNTVWAVADLLNGLMALPNIIALILLTGVIRQLTRDFFKKE